MSFHFKPRQFSRFFLSLFVLVILSFPVEAGNGQSAVRGRILDPDGAVVSGATVIAETSGRQVATTKTNDRGEFFITLPAGEYTLKVSADGFAETVQSVNLKPDTPGSLDIALKLAPSSAIVTITAGGGYLTEAVSSATRTFTPLRDVPQSIAVVTAEQIRDQSLQSIADVVAYVPGIASHQGENNRDQLVIRGNSTSADFFLNGVRDDVQYYRDLYNVDRMEAIKGPNAMIFGRGGGGGVINTVTKEAGFSRLGEITLQGGSFRNRRVTGDFNQPISKKIAFRINGLYENTGSFRQSVDLER
jgi:outer membrane receptor protein involved in Fe transport